MKITTKVLLVFIMIFVRGVVLQTDTSPDIQKAEKDLLSILGLKQRPIADKKKAQIPQAMINLYQKKINHDSLFLPLPGSLTRSANTVRSYTHQESSIDKKFLHNHRFRLSFDLSNYPPNEMVTSAELVLSLKVPKNVDHNHERVSVYDIVQPGIKTKTKPILRIVDTKLIHNETSSRQPTISLDVLPIIERWLSNPKRNHGLLVDVRLPTGEKISAATHVRLKRSADEEDESSTNWDTAQPLLLLYSDDKKHSHKKPTNWTELSIRQKRSTAKKHKMYPHARNECSRRPLWVDFEKVGWNDWIVAPPGYDAFFCTGDCPSPLGDHLNTTNHAIVQSLVNSVYPLHIPKPCCVPTKLTAMSLLYLDDNNKAVLKTYNDMVVEGCGCR